MTQTKKSPGAGAGAKERTPRNVEDNPIEQRHPVAVGKCPPLPSEQFPARKLALMHARDRGELIRAAARFAYAALFVRRATGTAGDITGAAVAAEIRAYSKFSKVRPLLVNREMAAIVAIADAAALESAR